jgi:hypothetical protein
MNKQEQTDNTTTAQPANILDPYNIPATNIHYILHNLFRGLKPVRHKYRLTINEIIFLNGMYLYCKHVSTCMSYDACHRFIGYYNLSKIKYYISSLQEKGMIQIAEVIKGYNRYKLTRLGISVMDEIDDSFERCLYEWFNSIAFVFNIIYSHKRTLAFHSSDIGEVYLRTNKNN